MGSVYWERRKVCDYWRLEERSGERHGQSRQRQRPKVDREYPFPGSYGIYPKKTVCQLLGGTMQNTMYLKVMKMSEENKKNMIKST